MGILKLSMVAIGIAVGVTWSGVFAGWLGLLWLFFLVTAVDMTFVGIRILRSSEGKA